MEKKEKIQVCIQTQNPSCLLLASLPQSKVKTTIIVIKNNNKGLANRFILKHSGQMSLLWLAGEATFLVSPDVSTTILCLPSSQHLPQPLDCCSYIPGSTLSPLGAELGLLARSPEPRCGGWYAEASGKLRKCSMLLI